MSDDLDGLDSQIDEISDAIHILYDQIRDAKDDGYTYSQLEVATGFARGTLQNIVDGLDPRVLP